MTDRVIGLAYAATRFHSGQWSRGYRLMSRIGWQPRTDRQAALLPRDENTAARDWAAHYIKTGATAARALLAPIPAG